MIERPCDCAGRHRAFVEGGGGRIEPVAHQHEDDRCSELALGIGGCPGLPHCRDWILGAYRACETMAEVCDDKSRAFEIRITREDLELEFARRPSIGDSPSPPAEPTRGSRRWSHPRRDRKAG